MNKLKQNPLAFGLFLATAGGFAWAKLRIARARAVGRASGKHHRFIDPQLYTANNPPWLKGAVTAAPSDQELPPPLLEFLERFQNSQGQLLPQFGAAAREQLFALDPDVAYLNHGSYGATFRLALEVQGWYQQLIEAEPVHFMEHVAVPGMLHALASVAAFINADARDVVAVPNATTAVCTVLNCVPLAPGDVVCMFNTTYPAVRSALARKALASQAQLLEVQWTLEELSQPELVIQAFRQALRAVPRGRLKLVVLDYVISFPPAILPVAKLAQICRQAGAQVLVDAAHGVGAIPGLDIPAMGADYVTSNLHKWCCTPKGTAFLWVAPARQHTLVPLVTSHGYGLGMQGEFIWKGTTDLSAWLAVPASLHVIQALGEHRIAEHNHRLVASAAEQLLDWSNAALSASPPDAEGPAAAGTAAAPAKAAGPRMLGGDGTGANAGMLAVALPPLRGYHPASSAAATQLHEALFSQHRIEIPVAFIAGQLWVRLSAQIYNTWQDYQRLIAALQPLLMHAKPNETGAEA